MLEPIIEKTNYLIYRPDKGKLLKFKGEDRLYEEIVLKKGSNKKIGQVPISINTESSESISISNPYVELDNDFREDDSNEIIDNNEIVIDESSEDMIESENLTDDPVIEDDTNSLDSEDLTEVR